MTGSDAESNMSELDFGGDEDNPWVTVDDDYPRLWWQDE